MVNAKPLTTEWSIEGYRGLAAAVVVDAFKVAFKAKKVLYSFEHEDESINTRRMVRSVRRRATWRHSAGEFSAEGYLLKCERELNEVISFVRDSAFTLYTDLEPGWFLEELDRRLDEWVFEEELKIKRERQRRKKGRQ